MVVGNRTTGCFFFMKTGILPRRMASSQALQPPILTDDDRCIRDDYMKLDSDVRDLLTDAKFVTIPDPPKEIIVPGDEPRPEEKVSFLILVQSRISR